MKRFQYKVAKYKIYSINIIIFRLGVIAVIPSLETGVLSTNMLVCTGVMSYHHEGISDPQSFPVRRASGNLDGLTVDCNHHGWSFTHCTPTHMTQQWQIKCLASSFIQPLFLLPLSTLPADVRLDALSGEGSHGHGHGFRRGQPVGVVVAGGEVTDVVDVAEHKGHGAEPAQTAASRAWNRG